ncbi:MAG: SDR family NAD(P)-dependent oxidoreductase [Parvibaculaceae bacterium]
MMMETLRDRVCIVTGAHRGLGAVFARHMAGLGARVVAADIRSTSETVAAIRAAGGEAVEATGDVQTQAGAEAIVAAATEAFGKLDILVNNAALYGGIQLASFDRIAEDEWDLMMSVNVKGVWQMCRAAVPAMKENGYGRIVNVSSNVVFMGKPGFLHYVASKGAVWAMTGALSRELSGTGITVNGIAPGYTITEATRSMSTPDYVVGLEEAIIGSQSVKRLIEADDLKGTIAFLASEAAGMITGQTVIVDGGTITG